MTLPTCSEIDASCDDSWLAAAFEQQKGQSTPVVVLTQARYEQLLDLLSMAYKTYRVWTDSSAGTAFCRYCGARQIEFHSPDCAVLVAEQALRSR